MAAKVFSVAAGLACLVAVTSTATQSKADSIQLLGAGVFNFFDARQPDAALNNFATTKLLISTGANLVPSSTGAGTTFAQEQAFAAQTTVAASQNSQTFQVPFVNSASLPNQFFTSIPYNSALTGAWTITATNPNIGTFSFTGQPIAPTTPVLPFITNIQVSNASPNATVSWVQPTFGAPSNTIDKTTISVNDLSNNKALIDFFTIPSSNTSYNLSNLPSTPGGQALVAGHNYAISVDTTLFSSSTGAELSTARSYLNFAPQSAPAPFSGPIQLPTSAQTASGVQYSFNFNVLANTAYNIDPAVATGFIYQTGAGNPLFASLQLPNIGNPNPYQLFIWNGTSFVFAANLSANTIFNFANGGVSEFEVLGIASSLGLNPLNTNDFVTQVTFEGGGTFTGTMTPVVTPLPASWTMMLAGLALFGFFAEQRSKRGRTGRAIMALR